MMPDINVNMAMNWQLLYRGVQQKPLGAPMIMMITSLLCTEAALIVLTMFVGRGQFITKVKLKRPLLSEGSASEPITISLMMFV